MRVDRVLDREVVQAELLLHLAQQRLLGLVQPNPDELTVAGQRRLDLIDGQGRGARPAGVGGAVDDRSRSGTDPLTSRSIPSE